MWNPSLNAMFGRLDRNDASNKKRKRSFDYKLKRSMTANKVWRNNLTTVRMDRAAGRGYGEKAVVVKKSEVGNCDKKVISISVYRNLTIEDQPRIITHQLRFRLLEFLHWQIWVSRSNGMQSVTIPTCIQRQKLLLRGVRNKTPYYAFLQKNCKKRWVLTGKWAAKIYFRFTLVTGIWTVFVVFLRGWLRRILCRTLP
jgi:hypothetical protein